MIKKLSIVFYFLAFIIISTGLFYIVNSTSTTSYSQPITLSDKKVVYELPYPGILPDNPLYVIKALRDKILSIITREPTKKAELYLLFSDKRVAMVLPLLAKGKTQLALSTFSKGEVYFSQIPFLLDSAKKQGVKPSESLIYQLKQSNIKHREIIDTLTKEVPRGQEQDISYLLELNSKIQTYLSKL